MPKNILVIDDDFRWVSVIQSGLGPEYAFHAIETVDNIDELLDVQNPSLVITNWNLAPEKGFPDNLGVTVIDKIHGRYPTMPCVVITASEQYERIQARYPKVFVIQKTKVDFNRLSGVVRRIVELGEPPLFLNLARELRLENYQFHSLLRHPNVVKIVENIQVSSPHISSLEAFNQAYRLLDGEGAISKAIVKARRIQVRHDPETIREWRAHEQAMKKNLRTFEISFEPLSKEDKKRRDHQRELLWKIQSELGEFTPPEEEQNKARQKQRREVLREISAETFTWLHLSDLHFENTAQRTYQISQVTSALVKDLKRLKQEHSGLQPDAIFFTGDLASRAKPEEYTKAWEECLSQVLKECKKSCNLFIVPGNHDADRTRTTEWDIGVIREMRDASQIHALLNDPNWEGYRKQLFQRIESYQSAIGSFPGLPFDPKALSWGRTLDTVSGKQVGVLGLNSVWTSASVRGVGGEVIDRGKLIIGTPLVQMALKQIPQKQLKLDVCIAMMHHPLDWLQDWDKQDIRQILGERCQFILHGHVHETTIDFLGTPSPTTMIISAGALFKRLDQRDVYTCLHAYNIVKLDLANDRGTIYFRRYDPVRQRYGIDDTTFGDVRNGQYSFQYGEGGFRPNGNRG